MMRLPRYQVSKLIKARLLRKHRGGLIKRKTEAESAFEHILKKLGVDFVFQAGFLTSKSFYIVDFYIKSPYKLVVEIDGNDHKEKSAYSYDKEKIGYLRRCGFKVLRFLNDTVLNEEDKVERQLYNCLSKIIRR